MAVRTPPFPFPSASVTAEQPVVREEGFVTKVVQVICKTASPASAAITPIHTADHSLREAHLIRTSLGMRFGKAAKKKIARPAADVVRKGSGKLSLDSGRRLPSLDRRGGREIGDSQDFGQTLILTTRLGQS